jgi:hypothetical protein
VNPVEGLEDVDKYFSIPAELAALRENTFKSKDCFVNSDYLHQFCRRHT